jgi:uncharacterized protein
MSSFDDLTAANRAIIESMFDPARSIGEAYLENLADFVQFRIIGSGIWSGSFRNKSEFLSNVFFALAHELDGIITLRAEQIIVEGDWACVRAQGRSRVKNGKRYDNDYCMVYRFAGGRIAQVTEYLDTEMVAYSFGYKDQHKATPVRQPQSFDAIRAVEPSTNYSSNAVTTDPIASRNKDVLKAIYADPARDYGADYFELLADDVVYHIKGGTRFSGTFNGRDAVRRELFEPLMECLDGPLSAVADNVFAEGDWVAAQVRGMSKVKNGRRYDNDYCLVFRLKNERIVEVHEYLDTELVTFAFGGP